jgi:hypothetical protein
MRQIMKRNILGIPLFLVAASAVAMTTTTPSPSAGKMDWEGISKPPAAAKAMADDSSGMRNGTVEAVSVGGGTFHVYGQRLNFDTKRVKVFGKDGKAATIYSLRAGAKVRFTMDPADPSHRRVAVIYLD